MYSKATKFNSYIECNVVKVQVKCISMNRIIDFTKVEWKPSTTVLNYNFSLGWFSLFTPACVMIIQGSMQNFRPLASISSQGHLFLWLKFSKGRGAKSCIEPHLVIPQNFHFDMGNKDLASWGSGHPKKIGKLPKTGNLCIYSHCWPIFANFWQFFNLLRVAKHSGC